MRRAWRRLTALGGSLLLAGGAAAAPPSKPAASAVNAASAHEPAAIVAAEDQEMQPLLDRLNALGEILGRDSQSPQAWRHQMEQSDILLRVAGHFKGEERDSWLRMAVDSHRSAAIQSPENDPTAYQRLVQLTARLARTYPGSPVLTYAALQEIRADYMLALRKDGEHPERAKELLCGRLVRFAQEHPKAPEALESYFEAGQISEELGRTDDARRCYRYLSEHFPGKAVARKAGGALWRLGLDGEALQLHLPQLFAADEHGEAPFDLTELRGKIVVVYFWSKTTPQAADDFQALRRLTDHHQSRGLEVVYVNMDSDPASARVFLSGRLLVGTHVYERGGLDGPVAERYGIQTLPQTFLVGKDGILLRHSLPASQLDAEVSRLLPGEGKK